MTHGSWAGPQRPLGPAAAGLSLEDVWDRRLLGWPPEEMGHLKTPSPQTTRCHGHGR